MGEGGVWWVCNKVRLCGVGRGEGGMQQVSLCRGERERVGMQQGETVREGVG